MKKKSILIVCISVLIVLCSLSITSCGNKSIVGTWTSVENEDLTLTFYEDNTCYSSQKNISSTWKIEKDGTLIIEQNLGGSYMLKQADTKEQALDDNYTYFLSGNTLVMQKQEFVRN